MALEGPRVLEKVLSGVNATTESDNSFTINSGQGWDAIGNLIAAQRTYFDLSGYTHADLTTFVQGVDFQYAGPPSTNDVNMQVLDLISTEYLTDAEILATCNLAFPSSLNGPGFTLSVNNQSQIVFGRRRIYALDSAAVQPELPRLHSLDRWGTCGALSCAKLHITRILIAGSASKSFSVPDVNVVSTVIVGKEEDLSFIMRQKRSYETAKRV